ncbi:cobalamin biosynthesis protein [Nocardia beijingensis]|uniref:cobalamin biosynthesis protein n=1 Tax=Nocardia beijingensis TaxID=95162 RepID=UPI0018956455|nr:cobalamin biosynthesis protein [Nocardia beijingensis]MBF6464198.1 cobalamin biosynthesis protein [Nocardia beijingensis]
MPPAEVVVGIGLRRGTSADTIRAALREAVADHRIAGLATIAQRRAEPGLLAVAADLRVPLRSYSADELSAVAVPNPGDRTRAAVGTASVAEAAALLATGGGPLALPKRVVHGVVLAAALSGPPPFA